MVAGAADGPRPVRRELHILRERDVGLFSLVQQVLSHVPWALAEGRTPIAAFGSGCAYWTPRGHRGAETVWEYYFEPVVADAPYALLEPELLRELETVEPGEDEVGRRLPSGHFVSRHFGDHPDLEGRTLRIPYLWDDPEPALRRRAAVVVRDHARPRSALLDAARQFRRRRLGETYIAVHLRGTDAISKHQVRAHRKGSLSFRQVHRAVGRALRQRPDAPLFVATDSEASLRRMRARWGDRVVAREALRHRGGESAGWGPDGGLLPAYVAADRDAAAQNGEEAVIDYLLLAAASLLIHNGSGLARTALLASPELAHVNTHLDRRAWVFALRNAQRVVQAARRLKGRRG